MKSEKVRVVLPSKGRRKAQSFSFIATVKTQMQKWTKKELIEHIKKLEAKVEKIEQLKKNIAELWKGEEND